MSEPTIRCGEYGDVPHNGKRWTVRTNRHPSCSGKLWGWIDGTGPNVCWSNDADSTFRDTDAFRVCKEHNTWLEEQTPLDLRIIAQRQEVERLKDQLDNAIARYQAAGHAHTAAGAELLRLEILAANRCAGEPQ